MFIYLSKLKAHLSVQNSVIQIRKDFAHSICYKKKHRFLRYKSSPVKSLSNRIMSRGNHLKIYKFLKKYYNNFLLKILIKKIPITSNFYLLYKAYRSTKNFDKVLLYKLSLLDHCFTLKYTISAESKNAFYIDGVKKILVPLNHIKSLLLLKKDKKGPNLTHSLLTPLTKFLVDNEQLEYNDLRLTILRYRIIKLYID